MSKSEKAVAALFLAAQKGEVSRLKRALADGANVNALTDDYLDHGQTALFVAANRHHKDVVMTLLDAGADVRLRTHCPQTSQRDGGSVLHSLLHSEAPDDPTLLTVLLDAGAEIDAEMNGGDTALSQACSYRMINCVRLLLARGTRAHFFGGKTTVALVEAARSGSIDIVKLLLDEQVPVDIATDAGLTPLMLACFEGQTPVVELLLSHGADISRTDVAARTAVHHLCDYANRDNSEGVQMSAVVIGTALDRAGVSWDVRSGDGRLPVDYLDYIRAESPFATWLRDRSRP
jgi:ankyrin repeat protein